METEETTEPSLGSMDAVIEQEAPQPMQMDDSNRELSAMMAQYESPLLRYVIQLLWPDEVSSQDVVQNTFLKCHSYIRKHGRDALSNPKAWLYRVAHNLSMDILRKRKRQGEIHSRLREDPAIGPGAKLHRNEFEDLEKKELYELALRELQSLPDEQKHILMLKHIQGMTLQEISDVTGIKIGTVNYRLTQGLKALAGKLKDR